MTGLIGLAVYIGTIAAPEVRQAAAELREEREAAQVERQRQGERDKARDAAEMERLKKIQDRAATIQVLQDRQLKGIKVARDGKDQ